MAVSDWVIDCNLLIHEPCPSVSNGFTFARRKAGGGYFCQNCHTSAPEEINDMALLADVKNPYLQWKKES